MKVSVMGAGAVGCYYGAMLARAGHAVTLIGRPAHVEAIRAGGLRFEARGEILAVPLAAETGPEAVSGAQCVLFCVKSADTEAAGAAMRPHLAPDAAVLSLQNGVDNAERLAATLGRAVIPAVVYVAADMAGPGHIRHHGRGELVLGESPRSAALAAAFAEAAIPTEVSANALGALWAKLILNCAYNALSAIPQLPYGALPKSPGVQAVMQDVVAECLAVARELGVAVPGDTGAALEQVPVTMPGQYSSTAQDLGRGRPTEIDHLNGYIARKGMEVGVQTPVNRALHAMVKLMEAKPVEARPKA